MNDNYFVGNKYEASKGLTTTEIAKAIRHDLKNQQAAGNLNKVLKFSVKTAYFAGGSSIRVNIKGAGEVRSPDAWGRNVYTEEAKKALDVVEAVVNSYNFDGSDTMTDYFHVRFYGNVDFAE